MPLTDYVNLECHRTLLNLISHIEMIFPTIAVMTTPCYIRFLHFCELSLISESTSLRLVRSMLTI